MQSSTTFKNIPQRSQIASALLLVLTSFTSFNSSHAQATIQDPSTSAQSTSNSDEKKPSLRSKDNLPSSDVLYSYNLPPAGPSIAKYTFDKLGRIASADFPNGLKISSASYMGNTDILLGFNKQENGVVTKYSREAHGGMANFGWKYSKDISGLVTQGQIVADIRFTFKGGYAYRVFDNQNQYYQITENDGKINSAMLCADCSIVVIDQQKRPIQLLRPNGTVVAIEYAVTNKANPASIQAHKNPITISDRDINGNVIKWSFKNNLWEPSLTDIRPSRDCPLILPENLGELSLIPLMYSHRDGSSVSIASNGDKSIFFPDNRVATYDALGKLRIVQLGMSSRTFIYDLNALIAIEDRYGSHVSRMKLPNEYGEHTADPSGNILLSGSIIAIQPTIEAFHLGSQTTTNRRVFPILGRIRDLAGRCPGNARFTSGGAELVRGEFPIFLPANIKLGEVRRVAPVKIISYCDLKELETRQNGTYKPIVQFLRTWAELATDEEIENVTNPNFLRELNVLMNNKILNDELCRGGNADYLIWIRDAIKAGKLPFALDIKHLNTYEVGNFQGSNFGGVTLFSKTPGTDGFSLSVNLNRQNYSPSNLSRIHQSMLNGGGLGLYARRETDFFVSLFHEGQHAYAFKNGINYTISPEPSAHFAAFSALALISPEEAQSFNFLSNSVNK